ncbi:MAG: DNA repair protein RadA [Desulfovibrionaceae bacterium]
MKTRDVYRCSACGADSPRWQGQCPGCGAWNTLELVAATRPGSRPARADGERPRPAPLAEHRADHGRAAPTGMPALDALLGRGLVPGGAVLLGGEPGIGKSTLLLQLAGGQAARGVSVAYLSGEESLGQLRDRAERLGLLDSGLPALATTRVEDALALLEDPNPPRLLVVDSVQTIASPNADGIPGSVSQVRAVAAELVDAVKRTQATLILVGHVTKEGHIAGPKLLEHMVDTVLYLEGDRRHFSRILRVLKNRFGPTDELVVFTMTGQGLAVVDDPATFFLGARQADLPGAALALALEGRKPFAVEVQALCAKTQLPVPRRTCLGFDANRLHLLLAVLERRLNLSLGAWDVYVKIGGGLHLKDPGLDLPVTAAVLSSLFDRALPENAVFWGEVDLNGQIRPAPGQDVRRKQAERLGYAPILEPAACPALADLQRRLFGR